MPTIIQLRLITGLIVGTYVTLHLSNHALGLISVYAQESARPWVMAIWHSWPGQIALYGSLVVHAFLGLYSLARRRHYRMPAWEMVQVAIGLLIPYLLLVHIVNTRGTRILTRIDIDYIYEIANLWVAPANRYRQVLLVLLVWSHFAVGLHFWLRLRPWYRRAFPAMLLGYVLIPLGGLLGFAHVGMTMTARAAEQPSWWKEVSTRGNPADAHRKTIRTNLKNWVGPSWAGLVGLVFVGAQIRNLLWRRHHFAVTYPPKRTVSAPIGMSLLEVSRMCGHPHMSACGGRARCTTCRVRVTDCTGELPPPAPAEARALARIGAPPGLRLACQTRPHVDLAVQPLLGPTVSFTTAYGANPQEEFGQERYVTVLFLDIRGSAALAEKRMPYDVVFLFNQLFAEMAEVIESTGGHYSNFTGDGMMVLFGARSLRGSYAARDALRCAAGMLDRLETFNRRLAVGMEKPIEIGIGLHSGLAIVGKMGPPKTPVLTAIGDAVNTAARLETLTRELAWPIVASADVLGVAGVTTKIALREVQIKGRKSMLRIAPMDGKMLRAIVGRANTSG